MPKAKKKSKKYTIELTPLSAWILGGIFLGLLVWMFILGIFAENLLQLKSLSPVRDLKNPFKKFQEMVGKREEHKDIKPSNQDKDPELAFYEKLTSKKEEVKRTKLPEKKEEATDEITLFREPAKRKISEPDQEKTTVVNETAEKEDALKAKPPPSINGGQQFTVQIHSFTEKEKAEKVIKSLVDLGYDAYYYTAEVKGKTYYRIRVGRFEDRSSALEYSIKLERETGYEGFVSKVE